MTGIWRCGKCDAREIVNSRAHFVPTPFCLQHGPMTHWSAKDLERECERLRLYVGDNMLRSDFRTVDDMRAELERVRERLGKAEGVLNEIKDHPHLKDPHCNFNVGPLHGAGMVEGHHCAADMAAKYFDEVK